MRLKLFLALSTVRMLFVVYAYYLYICGSIELPVSKVSTSGVEAGVRGTAIPDDNNDSSFLSALLGLICTRLCKDIVPVVEPASTTEFVPTSSTYGMCFVMLSVWYVFD